MSTRPTLPLPSLLEATRSPGQRPSGHPRTPRNILVSRAPALPLMNARGPAREHEGAPVTGRGASHQSHHTGPQSPDPQKSGRTSPRLPAAPQHQPATVQGCAHTRGSEVARWPSSGLVPRHQARPLSGAVPSLSRRQGRGSGTAAHLHARDDPQEPEHDEHVRQSGHVPQRQQAQHLRLPGGRQRRGLGQVQDTGHRKTRGRRVQRQRRGERRGESTRGGGHSPCSRHQPESSYSARGRGPNRPRPCPRHGPLQSTGGH